MKLSELTELVCVSTEQLGSFNIIPDVDFFILRVSAIIRGPHGKQDYVLAGGFLQREGDGDAATLPGQVRLHSVNHLSRPGNKYNTVKNKFFDFLVRVTEGGMEDCQRRTH